MLQSKHHFCTFPGNKRLNYIRIFHRNSSVAMTFHDHELRVWNCPVILLRIADGNKLRIAIVDDALTCNLGAIVIPLSEETPHIAQARQFAITSMQAAVQFF